MTLSRRGPISSVNCPFQRSEPVAIRTNLRKIHRSAISPGSRKKESEPPKIGKKNLEEKKNWKETESPIIWSPGA